MPFNGAPTGLSGASLATLGGIGVSVLAALYLMGRQRRRVVVSFVSLWVPNSADTFIARWARRLRRLVSLILQLGILAMVLLAASDPAPAGRHADSRTVVLLIDRSASMRATDEPGSRLQRARVVAKAMVDGLGPDERALVASFATQPVAASGMDGDHERLKAAIDTIAPSDEPGALAAALAFATAVLRGCPNPTLIVIGDGGGPAVTDAATLASLDKVDVRFVPVGRRSNNVGLVAFSARRLPADPSAVELALVTQNFGTAPTTVIVNVTAGPKRIPVARRVLHMEPGVRTVTTVSGVAAPDPRFEAHFENGHDDLSLDDHAYAVAPRAPPVSVLVVGRDNLYLDGALLGMSGDVRVDHIGAQQVTESRKRWGRYGVVIFDGVTPDPAPETGCYLYLDPHGAGSPWRDRGSVVDPVVTDVARDHPLVKHLGLSDLNVTTARRLVLGPGDQTVVSAVGVPLIVARERPGLREVAVAFDVRGSDLPLRSAFPLLVANTLSWLTHQRPSDGFALATGQTTQIEVAPLTGAAATTATAATPSYPPVVDVFEPDGRVFRTPVTAAEVTLSLTHVGIFRLVGPDGHRIAQMAANLASPAESDTNPRTSLHLGDRTLLAPAGSRHGERYQFWLAALVIALALATLEWLTFHRRITV